MAATLESPAAAQASNAGQYSVDVSDSLATATSDVASLSFIKPCPRVVWERMTPWGRTQDSVGSVTVSPDGHFYVAGNYDRGTTFQSLTLKGQGWFVAKYDDAGNCLRVWTDEGRSEGKVLGVKTDPEGNLVLAGYFAKE
ncbi:MAG: hypothetical protein AB1705_21455 [Verrucomicrobiota bacterium]